jgi:hypothetical protein
MNPRMLLNLLMPKRDLLLEFRGENSNVNFLQLVVDPQSFYTIDTLEAAQSL